MLALLPLLARQGRTRQTSRLKFGPDAPGVMRHTFVGMNVLVSGASGLVGSALVPRLVAGGHRVIELRRSSAGAAVAQATWDVAAGRIDLSQASPLDAVVHLAGESIAQRWTPAAQARIRDSRVRGTRLLCEALAALPQPPRVFVSASATGFYGDRGDETLDEQSAPGTGFLADVCRDWEAAAEPAQERGLRVVHLRFGVVLAPKGGALAKMLPAFRLGLGGPVGTGRQWWSWIALDDLVGAISQALTDDKLRGPVNAVSPHSVTNREFARTLGRVLGRPSFMPLPVFAVKKLLGEMGREALLASARVRPAKLLESGFQFQFPELRAALEHLLAKKF